MSTDYIPALMDALLTIDIAVHYHAGKNPNDVIRRTSRQRRRSQTGMGSTYMILLATARDPYGSFINLQHSLEALRP